MKKRTDEQGITPKFMNFSACSLKNIQTDMKAMEEEQFRPPVSANASRMKLVQQSLERQNLKMRSD